VARARIIKKISPVVRVATANDGYRVAFTRLNDPKTFWSRVAEVGGGGMYVLGLGTHNSRTRAVDSQIKNNNNNNKKQRIERKKNGSTINQRINTLFSRVSGRRSIENIIRRTYYNIRAVGGGFSSFFVFSILEYGSPQSTPGPPPRKSVTACSLSRGRVLSLKTLSCGGRSHNRRTLLYSGRTIENSR